MKKIWVFVLGVVLAVAISAATAQQSPAPLPVPVTNNAVVAIKAEKQILVYSFVGLGAKKTLDSITNAANALNVRYDKWTTIRSVPGSGRLGAVAVAVNEQVFLVGGFVPDQSGLQTIVPDVSVYAPFGLRWFRGPDLPTPIRDAAAGVYRDRYIYVIGGFSMKGPTNEVQLYDTESKTWSQATAFPGPGVFGHAGTVVGDAIIYIDGARASGTQIGPPYVPSDECWMGKIDRRDPKKIQWNKLSAHPGSARYRTAAGGSDHDQRAYFVGGSEGVYDYNGIGLDGKPAEPSPVVFGYNFRSNTWETITDNDPDPTMDHRGLVVTSDGLIVVGGMEKNQKVVATVRVLPKKK